MISGYSICTRVRPRYIPCTIYPAILEWVHQTQIFIWRHHRLRKYFQCMYDFYYFTHKKEWPVIIIVVFFLSTKPGHKIYIFFLTATMCLMRNPGHHENMGKESAGRLVDLLYQARGPGLSANITSVTKQKYFHTSDWVSISQIFNSLFKSLSITTNWCKLYSFVIILLATNWWVVFTISQ